MMLLVWCLVALAYVKLAAACEDPVPEIPQLARRTPGHEVVEREPWINDHEKWQSQWYSAGGFQLSSAESFPDNLPGRGRCGTLYPVYLTTQLNIADLGSDPAPAQMRIGGLYQDHTGAEFGIEVRTCGTDIQYFLPPTPIRFAGYCFDQLDDTSIAPEFRKCGSHINEEIDFSHSPYINSGFSFYNETQEDGSLITRPATELTCEMYPFTFGSSSTQFAQYADSSLRVLWFVDSKLFRFDEPFLGQDFLAENRALHETDLVAAGYDLNSYVQCGIEMSVNSSSHSCLRTVSGTHPLGFGMASEATAGSFHFQKGSDTNILQPYSNTPLGCSSVPGDGRLNCTLKLDLVDEDGTSQCKKDRPDAVRSDRCGMTLMGLTEAGWQALGSPRYHSVNYRSWTDENGVYRYETTGMFIDIDEANDDTHSNFKLQMQIVREGTGHRIWENYQFPDFNIQVYSQTGETTEGGDYFYCNLNSNGNDNVRVDVMHGIDSLSLTTEGIFTVFRLSETILEVRLKTGQCGDFICGCGFSVRRNNDVFVCDYCDQHRFCGLVQGDGEYLSSQNGTSSLSVQVGNFWMSGSVYDYNGFPSAHISVYGHLGGVETVEGLCMDPGDGLFSEASEEFAESWRLPDVESLWDPFNDVMYSVPAVTDYYCVCPGVDRDVPDVVEVNDQHTYVYTGAVLCSATDTRTCTSQYESPEGSYETRTQVLPGATSLAYRDDGHPENIIIPTTDGVFQIPEGGWLKEGRAYFVVEGKTANSNREDRIKDIMQKIREQKKGSHAERPKEGTRPTIACKEHTLTRTKNPKIRLGWQHYRNNSFKQVLFKNGGGVRELSLSTLDIDVDAVIQLGKDVFFHDGMSKNGMINDMEAFLGDYAGRKLESFKGRHEEMQNLGNYLHAQGIHLSRTTFYLMTKEKENMARTKAAEESGCNVNNMDACRQVISSDHSPQVTTSDPSLPIASSDPGLLVTSSDPSRPVSTSDSSAAVTIMDPSQLQVCFDPDQFISTSGPSQVNKLEPIHLVISLDPNQLVLGSNPGLSASKQDPKELVNSSHPAQLNCNSEPNKSVITLDPSQLAVCPNPAQLISSSDQSQKKKDTVLLPLNHNGDQMKRQNINIQYIRERSSKYSSERIGTICHSVEQCQNLTSMDEYMSDEPFNPCLNGFDIGRIEIGGKCYLDTDFQTTDGIVQKVRRFPSSTHHIHGLILHDPFEIWGYDDDKLLIGTVPGVYEGNIMYEWYKDNEAVDSGPSASMIVVKEPGVYSCRVSFADIKQTTASMEIVAMDAAHAVVGEAISNVTGGSESFPVMDATENATTKARTDVHTSSLAVPDVLFKDLNIDHSSALGQGAFGVVNKGTWEGTEVAIKTVSFSKRTKKTMMRMIEKEIEINSKLRHPNIVQFLAVSREPTSVHLVHEYIKGCNMEELIFDEDTKFNMALQPKDKLYILKQCVQALAYLHALVPVVLHQDIKPSNIMIRKGCFTTKLCDMGVSRIKSVAAATTTAGHGMCGSPAYTAPEVLLHGAKTNPATDIWSLGITLIEFLAEEDAWMVDGSVDPVSEIKEKMGNKDSPLQAHNIQPTEIVGCLGRCVDYDESARPAAVDILSYV